MMYPVDLLDLLDKDTVVQCSMKCQQILLKIDR